MFIGDQCYHVTGHAGDVSGGRKYFDPGVLNPCSRPNPPAGCHISDAKEKSREAVNDYQRGCSKNQRCRSG